MYLELLMAIIVARQRSVANPSNEANERGKRQRGNGCGMNAVSARDQKLRGMPSTCSPTKLRIRFELIGAT